jgi:hypothetical protein
MAKAEAKVKEATLKMRQKAPKKNSVLFESNYPESLFQAVYLMRDGVKQHLGIDDLDKIQEIEITVKAI